MTQSLKIECLVTDLTLEGEVASFLVTKEQLTAGLSKKADLVDGKIKESNLPDFIANNFQTINQKLVALEESISDGIQSAKDYSEAYTNEKLIVKADLVDGKVPHAQLPSVEQYEGLSEALNGVLDQARRDMIERTDEIQRTKADLGEDGKVVREQLPNYDKIPGLETVVTDLYDSKANASDVYTKVETLSAEEIEQTVEQTVERISPTRDEVNKAIMMSEVVQVHGFEQEYIDAGGYPFGAVLTLDDGVTQVKSAITNNKNNPNSNVVGWIPYGVGKFITGMSYGLNVEVILTNGDIVKSTVANNTTNPNVNMTGWMKTNDASFVVDGDKNQHQINDLQQSLNDSQIRKNSESVSMRDFGAIADGAFHPLSEKYATLAQAKAKYPFVSALTQSLDWAALQLAVDSVVAGTQIDVWDYVTDEPVYVNKKIKFNFKNSITEIEQLNFNKPIFAIQSKNVTSSGNLKGIYQGLRNTELLVLPTSSQSRLSTYYTLFSGAARILSTVVSSQGDVSGLELERVDSDGFFAGAVVNGNKNSATDSDTIKIGEINVTGTDWGVVPVGFKSMRIDVLRARNIQNIYPSDPSHAIYVSPRSAGIMNGSLSIGLLDVQSCAHTSGKIDKDAFSICSTKYAYIERLVIDDVAYIGNARDAAKLEINSLIGSLKSSATVSEITFALSAQTDSSITVNNIDLVSRNASDNSFVNPIFQHSSNGNIEIKSGKIQVSGANPSHISYGTGGKITVADGVEITYENEIPATSGSRHALVANTGAAFVKIGALQLNGNASRLLDIATADHEVKINPNLIKSGIMPLTYVNQGGVYKVSFTNFDRIGYNLLAGSTFASAQSCNTFNLLSTAAVVFTELLRPTSGQQYLLRNTGGGTTLGHNDAVNGIVLKGATNITGANWRAILLQCIGNRCYEVQRF